MVYIEELMECNMQYGTLVSKYSMHYYNTDTCGILVLLPKHNPDDRLYDAVHSIVNELMTNESYYVVSEFVNPKKGPKNPLITFGKNFNSARRSMEARLKGVMGNSDWKEREALLKSYSDELIQFLHVMRACCFNDDLDFIARHNGWEYLRDARSDEIRQTTKRFYGIDVDI